MHELNCAPKDDDFQVDAEETIVDAVEQEANEEVVESNGKLCLLYICLLSIFYYVVRVRQSVVTSQSLSVSHLNHNI